MKTKDISKALALFANPFGTPARIYTGGDHFLMLHSYFNLTILEPLISQMSLPVWDLHHSTEVLARESLAWHWPHT